MKKYFIIFILFSLKLFILYGQNEIIFKHPLKVVASEKINSDVRKGSEVILTGMAFVYLDNFPKLYIKGKTIAGQSVLIEPKKENQVEFKEIDNVDKVWDKHLVLNGTYGSILNNGYQYDFRNDLNSEAVDYVNAIASKGGFFDDKYFEDYMYTIINKIHSGLLNDERPGNLFIKILKDPQPNAFVLPNGSVVISTGLLSTIQSEDELVGVLAHEIAHFVLDHPILNYNKEVDRKKKAEFWSGVATIFAAGAEVFLASNDKDYIPGAILTSTAIASSVVSSEIISRLGVKYSQSQELAADKAAKDILEVLDYDKLGLSAALLRIKKYCYLTGNYLALSGSGSHPSISTRIDVLGAVTNFEKFTQPQFLKKVSLINSYNAWIELWYYVHHGAALDLASRNILNGIGTESDYIVKAMVMRRTSNSSQSNEEVISLLNKAKSLSVTPYKMIDKELGITYLRLEKKNDAKSALQVYLASLTQLEKEFRSNSDRGMRENLIEEINWAKQMIFKIDSF